MSDPSTRYYPDRPFACALAVCRRGERVLLARRAMGPGIGRWGFPGGMQELGETIEAGAARELLEETGIEAEPLHVIGASNVIGRDEQDKVRAHFTLIAVLLDWRAGEGEPIEDASEVGWFTLKEAEALDSFADAMPLMRLALARQPAAG